MAQATSPSPLLPNRALIDVRTGLPTAEFASFLQQMWRQIAAGFVVVPVTIIGTNSLTLTPTLNAEGGRTYGDYMAFCGVAAATSTGAVTGTVTTARGGSLDTLKVYKSNGAAQAGSGDVVKDSLYLFIYNSALDGGAGGLVLK